MAVIADIIREVSLDLNDQEPGHEYVRWPFVQLHSYLREGLIDVSYRLKDLFTSSVVIEVESGEYWQKACTCTKVLRVVGLSTPQGRITRRLRRYLDTDEFIWVGAPCAAGQGLSAAWIFHQCGGPFAFPAYPSGAVWRETACGYRMLPAANRQ